MQELTVSVKGSLKEMKSKEETIKEQFIGG
jgi:hypothetical protein